MLNNFVQPASISTGQAVEGVQPIQGFAPYNQLTELVPAFKLADDGAKPEDEEKKSKEIRTERDDNEDENPLPDIFHLAINVSFREMIEYLFTPDHDKILDLRSHYREIRGVDRLTIFSPTGVAPDDFNSLRDKLYEFQMQLFSTPKGLHCHIIL